LQWIGKHVHTWTVQFFDQQIVDSASEPSGKALGQRWFCQLYRRAGHRDDARRTNSDRSRSATETGRLGNRERVVGLSLTVFMRSSNMAILNSGGKDMTQHCLRRRLRRRAITPEGRPANNWTKVLSDTLVLQG
jgi:hypothetical protein